MIVCAGHIEQFSFAHSIGIGLIDSAISLTRLCLASPPSHLLFVGSAGSYGEFPLLAPCVATAAKSIESGALTQSVYSPLTLSIQHFSPFVSRETFPEVVVNSSNYITADKGLSGLYAQEGLHIENMEFYAVLAVAKQFNIPAFGLFVTTNYCCADAHKTFIANHQAAKIALENLVMTHFKDLA
jgi:nucleoside phosphorylase